MISLPIFLYPRVTVTCLSLGTIPPFSSPISLLSRVIDVWIFPSGSNNSSAGSSLWFDIGTTVPFLWEVQSQGSRSTLPLIVQLTGTWPLLTRIKYSRVLCV